MPKDEKKTEQEPQAATSGPTTEELESTDSAPNQPSEDRADVLKRAQPGMATATGRERARLADDTPRRKGAERGSTQEHEGDIKADYPTYRAPKPQGAQAKPANLAVNGTVPVNHIPSPSGPIPRDAARSVGMPQEELLAQRGAGVHLDASKPVPDELIDTLDGPTLRSIAADRGYSIPNAGTRTVRARFRAADRKAFQEATE